MMEASEDPSCIVISRYLKSMSPRCRVPGLERRVSGLELRPSGLGFRVCSLGFRV